MIQPEKAPVRPRVYLRDSSETVPLEDILSFPSQRTSAVVSIVGPWGAGKSTALAHLADRFSDDPGVVFLDDAQRSNVKAVAGGRLLIFASVDSGTKWVDQRLRLAPWGQDELIEYLLAVHPRRCGSVIDRLAGADDRQSIPGLPELWRIVLDRMAEDESVTSVRAAVLEELDSRLPSSRVRKLAEEYCLDCVCGDQTAARTLFGKLTKRPGRVAGLVRLLGHGMIRVHLAADRLVPQLDRGAACDFLTWRLPAELIDAVATRIAPNERILARLARFAEARDPRYHSTAATLLHATGSGWTPKPKSVGQERKPHAETGRRKRAGRSKATVEPTSTWLNLSGASLPGADWPEVDLAGVVLTNADLTAADLADADLSGSDVRGACFHQASLAHAELSELTAIGASFYSANLSGARAQHAKFHQANLGKADFSQAELLDAGFAGANLTGARFVGAHLAENNFSRARIEGADFSDATLTRANLSDLPLRRATFTGAIFPAAQLYRVDLESVALPDAVFDYANLTEALLTGSVMPRASFRDARLVLAGLANIDWEGADLRRADLRGASFHLGSSRSGLVDSPLASEGTRTGFYGDDFNQRSFKPPEEIRKANLRGADLRGAKIEKVDFYLVDLRDARYTTRQLLHFRQCGAILEDRARDPL